MKTTIQTIRESVNEDHITKSTKMIITTNANPKVQVLMSFTGGSCDGYNFGDFFPGLDIHQDFKNAAEAEEALASAYVGEDGEGVSVKWGITE